jgi:pyridoxal phosphate-dependent aminotransferase EpsN
MKKHLRLIESVKLTEAKNLKTMSQDEYDSLIDGVLEMINEVNPVDYSHDLEARVAKKRYIFEKYKSSLASLPIEFQPEPECGESNRWLTSVLITDGAGVTPADIISALSKADIEARHLWNPMHRQPVFNSAKFVSAEDDAVSTDLFMRGVCLPSDTKMTDEDIDRVCETIKSLF